MRYLELKYKEKVYKNPREINDLLRNLKFYWLIDSEIEHAKLEINNNTLIWHEGDFFSGNWEYGIFKGGKFFGNWINGIWENGNFSGKWQSGIGK